MSIVHINEKQKQEMQRDILIYFANTQYGGTTKRLSREEHMSKYWEDQVQWKIIKDIIYALHNIGVLSTVGGFSGTSGKAYRLSPTGLQYWDIIRDDKT